MGPCQRQTVRVLKVTSSLEFRGVSAWGEGLPCPGRRNGELLLGSLSLSVMEDSPPSRRQSWHALPTCIYLDGAFQRHPDMCTSHTRSAWPPPLELLITCREQETVLSSGKPPVKSGSFPRAGCRARGAIWPSGGTAASRVGAIRLPPSG